MNDTFAKYSTMALLAAAPTLAMAHPGHAEGGFGAAFAHPFSGIDHLLMLLAVGVMAGRSGGAARWRLPAIFVLAMVAGWLAGARGLIVPGVETGIAAGLIAAGALLAAQVKSWLPAQFAAMALFAALHGMAHGIELGGAPVGSALGFVTAAIALLGGGIACAALLPQRQALHRGFGALVALCGGVLLGV